MEHVTHKDLGVVTDTVGEGGGGSKQTAQWKATIGKAANRVKVIISKR